MRVILEVNDRFAVVPVERFRHLAKEILVLTSRRGIRMPEKTALISLATVGDSTMRRLNKKFRGPDKTTDVLSFSFEENGEKEKFLSTIPGKRTFDLGEIIISYPQLRRQAKQYKSTVADELRRLFTHGLLHLLGYDHQQTRPRQLMEKLETLINKKYD